MIISLPGGNTLGFIHQLWDCLRPRFDILDADQQSVLTIEGPICACNLCGDVDFEVIFNSTETKLCFYGTYRSGLAQNPVDYIKNT